MIRTTDAREFEFPAAPFAPAAQLLRLHQHSFANLLVLGGTSSERGRVALQFHRESPLRTGPFVALDCEREETRLRSSLQFWMALATQPIQDNPLWAAARGTLFLDSIEYLSLPTQRLLLMFADRSAHARADFESAGWAGRLTVGNGEDLAYAVADGRFLAALYDHVDKIRVELEPARQKGAA